MTLKPDLQKLCRTNLHNIMVNYRPQKFRGDQHNDTHAQALPSFLSLPIPSLANNWCEGLARETSSLSCGTATGTVVA